MVAYEEYVLAVTRPDRISIHSIPVRQLSRLRCDEAALREFEEVNIG
jgi:hypothetical protein